jgi:cytochrome c5
VPASAPADADASDIFAGLPQGDAQLQALCARGHDDPVSERLCARPRIESLADLQRAVGVAIADPSRGNGEGGNASFALLGHSTSISGRLVSAINPRAFLFTSPSSIARVRGPGKKDPGFVAMGFTRGEQLVELVARDRETSELRFFLVRFEQACNAAGGCTNHDLFSPAIESSWKGVTVYEDQDLRNTVLDCRVCHQPGGPGAPKMLRMQELQEPWTHFFRAVDEGKEIIADYFRAHDYKESYASIPAFIVAHSQPARLEGLVEHEGFRAQPNEFPTASMALELGGGKAPQKSSNFGAIFREALDGTAIATPYPGGRASDPTKLAEAARGYRAVMAGKAPPDQMPSLADLHRDDARWMASLRPKPGLDGAGMLRQMCQRCHNSALDQTVSRSLFDVEKLGAMSRREKDEAIRRLELPASSRRKMPPPRFGELSEEEIAAVVEELRR